MWRAASPTIQRRALVAGLVLPMLLWPIYHARNERLADEGRLSRRVMTLLMTRLPTARVDAVVFEDDPQARPALWHAFGGLLPEVVALAAGRPLLVSLEGVPESGLHRDIPADARVLRVALVNGEPVVR
jgi:hypothetical protein